MTFHASATGDRPKSSLPDLRHLGLVVLCSHSFGHRHIGIRGGSCRCGAKWCTLRPYDCEVQHP